MDYKVADAALTDWGLRIVEEMSSGLGYPSSTAEGRANRNGPGRTDQVFSSIVPRMVDWSELQSITHKGVMNMPGNLRSVCRERYVDEMLNKKTVNRSRKWHGILREARIWITGWLTFAASTGADGNAN